jgi:hypothetical protein
MQIIARYDEVISDKAPKHAITELRQELLHKAQQLGHAASKHEQVFSDVQRLAA